MPKDPDHRRTEKAASLTHYVAPFSICGHGDRRWTPTGLTCLAAQGDHQSLRRRRWSLSYQEFHLSSRSQ